VLKAATLFMREDSTRPSLTGALFEWDAEGNLMIVATDGFSMMKWAHKSDNDVVHGPGSVVIPLRGCLAVINEASKQKNFKRHEEVYVIINEGKARILARLTDGNALENSVLLLDAKYPDWRKIVRMGNKCKPVKRVGITPAYFLKFADAAAIISGESTAPIMEMRFTGEESVVEIRVPTLGDSFVGYLMPARLT